ncbi:MAG: glucose-1-phosphate thymidylyltransferase RfbA [Gemmatimonadota bacterium]
MKGIIIAGGSGTRLHPVTKVVSKQLLPIYDKPMVHYPLSTLMLAGIREILVISTPRDLPLYQELLGTGEELGLKFTYKVQPHPGGLAQAFLLGREFVGDDSVCLVLGDNVFYGHGLTEQLQEGRRQVEQQGGGTVFGYYVQDPQRYGVAEYDDKGNVVGLEEKPKQPKSNWAVAGIYFYDNSVLDIAANLKPSPRGELEITDVNREYLKQGKLRLLKMGRGIAWLDTGTHQSLLEASQFIATIEHRQGLKVACLEEIAWRMGFIDTSGLRILADGSPEGTRVYLRTLVPPGP